MRIANEEVEVSEADLNENFEYFLRAHFPKSLRKTGKRKWKSFFWVLFMLFMSLFVFWIGYYKMKYQNETMKELWSVFVLGVMLAIPGFYYGFILLMIFMDFPGFNFSMIPDSSN